MRHLYLEVILCSDMFVKSSNLIGSQKFKLLRSGFSSAKKSPNPFGVNCCIALSREIVTSR